MRQGMLRMRPPTPDATYDGRRDLGEGIEIHPRDVAALEAEGWAIVAPPAAPPAIELTANETDPAPAAEEEES